MDDTKPFWHLFRHNRNDEKPSEIETEAKLKEQIQTLVRNGIFFDFEERKAAPVQSKFGGKPALPKKFEWPYYTDEYGEHIVLPFFLQLSCEELSVYDTDNLLPHEGMFYLFYDLTNQPWRNSKGAKLLYTPTPISELVPTDFPENLPEEHRLPEMALKFTAHTCAPDWEDYVGMTGDDNTAYTDWDIIERKLGKWGYPHMESAGRILGYASLIQNGIAEACESRAQEEKQQTYSKKSAREWILLLQLNCIEEEEVDIPFGTAEAFTFISGNKTWKGKISVKFNSSCNVIRKFGSVKNQGVNMNFSDVMPTSTFRFPRRVVKQAAE